jgi:hypothetical protein
MALRLGKKVPVRFFGGPEHGRIADVDHPLPETVAAAPEQDVYRLWDYGVKLEFQEERYARVYVWSGLDPKDEWLLKQVATAYGWPEDAKVVARP